MPISDEASMQGVALGLPHPYPAGVAERYDTADYIMELSGQLSRLADDAGLELLSHLLAMAKVEAKRAKSKLRAPDGSPGPDV